MKKISSLIIILFLLLSCQFEQSSDDIKKWLSEAEDLYKKGLTAEDSIGEEYFMRSAILYEKAIAKGHLNNGYILYNTGNSWFQSGNLGKAILYYRKAQKRLPGNAFIQKNLMEARRKLPSALVEKGKNIFARTLLFLHYDLNFRTRFILLVLFSFSLFGSASVYLRRKKNYLKNTIIILSILSLLSVLSLTVDIFKEKEGVILKEVYGRKGDSEGYEKVFEQTLLPGIEFNLIEKREGWIYIKLKNGIPCWIPGGSASLIN